MKKPVCFFTIAGDDINLEYATMTLNSLRKFHPDIPHHLIDKKITDEIIDPHKFYRMYALIGEDLSKEYNLVINIDADSIVTGDLNHILEDKSYEIGGVLNNNEIDPKLAIWDTPHLFYVNAGFLAIRGERIWKWWSKLNFSSHWEHYQFREQDMLNIIFHYGDVKTKIFDFSDNWHGLIHKGQWHRFILKGDKIILPKTEKVCHEDKEIKIIHWGGGSVKKMNYWVHFKPEVAERLKWLTS